MKGQTEVSNADRLVFPEIGRTKGDVVAYYEHLAPRLLPHVANRPLSIKRYPKGLAGPGFFQKNVPEHYPATIARFPVPRSREATQKHKGPKRADVTVYPVVSEAKDLPYIANQGAIEFHVPTARVTDSFRPDRLILDLDPPPGELALVRRAARLVQEALLGFGLPTVPMATGSKGYHLVAAIHPTVQGDAVAHAMYQLATLLAARHPEELTTTFKISNRGQRVFVDWLRNNPLATGVAPYSLRARPNASVAAPLDWSELDKVAPDGFTLSDADALVERPDTIATLSPIDAEGFFRQVSEAFAESGLVLEAFDRFRS